MSGWESDPLVYAYDAEGELVHVDSVANGAACGCTCPSCKQPLIAKNGGGKLVHHFAHRKGACRWAVEAAVVLLAREAIARKGRMRVEGAGYYDICEERRFFFSPRGELDVSAADLMEVGCRQAPGLRIACTDEGGAPCEFALVVELARRFTEEQFDQLREAGLDVLSLDLRGAYAGMRDAEGRHFSRGEFFMRVQDPDYIQGVLSDGDGSEALRWAVHRRRDAAEEEADARYREKQRERMREYELELEQMLARMEADEQREREEARRKAEMRKSVIDAERRAFEREGVEALLKVRHGANFYIDDCPLLEQADVVADCGAYVWSPDKCIFFEGQRYYLIGCTARQNGVSLND